MLASGIELSSEIKGANSYNVVHLLITSILPSQPYPVLRVECVEGNLVRQEVVHHGAECHAIGEALGKVGDVDILQNW